MSIYDYKKIHCIGIGGIGVSALAQFLRAQGKEISGSDIAETELTHALRAQGIRIFIGHAEANLNEAEVVIYSDAVPADNPERIAARKYNIPELSYAQALGQISRGFQTIVVTGTNGKSTTTAMLGLILEAAGYDPFVIVGSKVPGWLHGNMRLPAKSRHSERSASEVKNPVHVDTGYFTSFRTTKWGRWMVVEGDDYRDHFLELAPYAVVVTNIEYDHPDYFRDLDHTVESFKKLVEKVPEHGFVIVNEDDRGCQQLLDQIQHSLTRTNERVIPYGSGSEIFGALDLKVPGEFNRYNATAAATCALQLGVSLEIVQNVLVDFKGIWRRFEVVGTIPSSVISTKRAERARGEIFSATNQDGKRSLPPKAGRRCARDDEVVVISDYGHHPSAIKATMEAAREFYKGRHIVLVYQPHQHSRTKRLFNEFVDVLKNAADLVIVSEIYAVKGRMEDHEVSSRDLVDSISRANIVYGGDLKQTGNLVCEIMQLGDVIIFMGAGDIDELARWLVGSK